MVALVKIKIIKQTSYTITNKFLLPEVQGVKIEKEKCKIL